MPQDDLNYGIIHGDFHTGNFMIRKADESMDRRTDSEESKVCQKASQYEVAAFDFDDIRLDWFLGDVAYAVNALMNRADEQA